MAANYPRRIASSELDVLQEDDGIGTGVLDRVRQMFCGMHGHDSLLQFEQDRMFLKCVSCGHETPGWELTETPPTVSVVGDARRHVMARPQLVTERRIA
jgi:hypothetical protein